MGILHRWLSHAVVVLMLLFAASACAAEPKVTIASSHGREVTFQVEIADTPGKRELGLQYRQELAPNRGMLFIFAEERRLTFWMKNTPIPLDMIFIGRDQKIVGIVEEAAPYSLDSRSVGEVPSQFVLEINGGLSRRYGFKPGNSVRFEGVRLDGVTE
jgi:uncharacterized membrane protein (UPF0127 family)